MTIVKCSNCGKQLEASQHKFAERTLECAECMFHTANGTRTIDKFNEWLKNGDYYGHTAAT